MTGNPRLMRGGTLVGELRPSGMDMPLLLHDFLPGPGWAEVGPYFEAMNAVGPHDAEERLLERAIAAIVALGLTLEHPDGGRTLRVHQECVLRIEDGEASVRYWVQPYEEGSAK
ncbi:hypothetical protein [Streptomyces lichenis]|uniref:Uncharacterized protein n=1 Tax=Streptomyces lichenis TaxID=2306967 RepID=A0ABT0IFS6_9ACTN|nr:hypothetical protein [Streptomyces lichenis]MCK8680183.1 hypothetical protein [Streptomyces lichenis]